MALLTLIVLDVVSDAFVHYYGPLVTGTLIWHAFLVLVWILFYYVFWLYICINCTHLLLLIFQLWKLGARRSIVGWGTVLQAGLGSINFSMTLLEFSTRLQGVTSLEDRTFYKYYYLWRVLFAVFRVVHQNSSYEITIHCRKVLKINYRLDLIITIRSAGTVQILNLLTVYISLLIPYFLFFGAKQMYFCFSMWTSNFEVACINCNVYVIMPQWTLS
jgi:hypothetical protein